MHAKLQILLWISQPALELPLVIVMFWRKMHRRFPVFLAYMIFQILNFAVIFPIHQYGGYDLYFYSYWISTVITLALGFKVIHEIFLDVFRPYHTLKDLGTVLFKWAALVMLLVAVVVAAASPVDQSPLAQAVSTLQRCVKVIQCGLVVFLILFSKYLGVSWRQQSFGIILGFGGYASVQLIGNALYTGGQVGQPFVNILYPAVYTFVVALWLGYSLVDVRSKQAAASLLTSQRWERSLADLQRPAEADSLIPMFEGMVDRAFSRTAPDSAQQFRATEEPAETVSSSAYPLSSLSLPQLSFRR
jgi:hypothetical protein